MKSKSGILYSFVIPLAALLAGCGNTDEGSSASKPPSAPAVDDKRQDLVLSWFEDGEPKTGFSVADVPEGSRGEVRVQDPSIPPEERDPDWIFLANLNKKGRDGKYEVKAVLRSKWENARRPKIEDSTETAGGAAPGSGGVIMYATKTCPVCMKARRWLVDKNISFVEKDVDTDQSAAMELAAKGKAKGVPTNGVPVFDVGGQLVPGFDPGVILNLLSGKTPPQAEPALEQQDEQKEAGKTPGAIPPLPSGQTVI